MADGNARGRGRNVPEGYVAAVISELAGSGAGAGAGAGASLRLAALVKETPDPVGGSLVVLRQTFDARVFLGCVVDVDGRVHQWVELWVQAGGVGGGAEVPAAARAAMSPDAMTLEASKGRWVAMVDAYDGLERPLLVKTGFERSDAPELAVQVAGAKVVLAPAGSRLMVRVFRPHGLEGFSALLSASAPSGGRPRLGVVHGKSVIDLDKSFGMSALDGGGLFLGGTGKCGRVIEAAHLKLRLLADCVQAVHDVTQATGRPVLNLRPESFQVHLGEAARGLPQWWTARAVLADPGDAIAMSVPTSDGAYYVSATLAKPSVYRPEALGSIRGGGRGQLRLRQVIVKGDQTIIEGTLSTDERVKLTKNDLVWMRMTVASKQLDLFGQLDDDGATGMATGTGELRFRTLGQRLAADVAKALQAASGVPLNDVLFEVVPRVSTACDLYALGVIGARLLLTGSGTAGSGVALPTVLDELFGLVRECNALAQEQGVSGKAGGGSAAAWELVKHVCASDPRWMEALGPHRLTDDAMTAEEAAAVVPSELWYRVLGVLVEMFPGMGPLSRCSDLGEAPSDGQHVVFGRALEGLDDLLRRTRSLIVIDWNANREIHAALRRFSAGVGGGVGAGRH